MSPGFVPFMYFIFCHIYNLISNMGYQCNVPKGILLKLRADIVYDNGVVEISLLISDGETLI